MAEHEFAGDHPRPPRRREGAPPGAAVLVAAVSALLGALWLGRAHTFDAGSLVPVSSGGREPAIVHVVAPSDTFWSIAERLEPGRDPRPVVDALVRAHGGPVLQAGERIALPHPLRG